MAARRVPTLLISGPVGVGKSAVADEVSSLLSSRGVAHTLMDLDVLAATYPTPADDRFNGGLALRNLACVWRNAAAVGSRNLVIARVVEEGDELGGYATAVPGAELVVVRLRASDATLVERVERRELGSGLAWHRDRAIELARLLDERGPAHLVVDTTERSVTDVAAEVAAAVDWELGS